MYKGLDSMIYFATPKAAIRFGGKEAFSGMLLPGGQDVCVHDTLVSSSSSSSFRFFLFAPPQAAASRVHWPAERGEPRPVC